MKGSAIEIGESYAIAPWRGDRDDDAPHRPGLAVEVRSNGMLAYRDSRGTDRTAHLSRVPGRWAPHEESLTAARAAADAVNTAAGKTMAFVREQGYAVHTVEVQMSAAAAAVLAGVLAGQHGREG